MSSFDLFYGLLISLHCVLVSLADVFEDALSLAKSELKSKAKWKKMKKDILIKAGIIVVKMILLKV